MSKSGFLDLQVAKDHAARREAYIEHIRAQHAIWKREAALLNRNKPFCRPTWRDVDRIAIPNYLINRQIRKIADRRTPVLDSVCLRLERLLERLDDKSGNLSRLEVLLRSIARWLLQSPNSERQSILEETPPDHSSAPTSGPAPEFDVTASMHGETGHE